MTGEELFLNYVCPLGLMLCWALHVESLQKKIDDLKDQRKRLIDRLYDLGAFND